MRLPIINGILSNNDYLALRLIAFKNRNKEFRRYQRRRMIARRLKKFAWWTGRDIMFRVLGCPPRPKEIIEKEFWTPRRVGKFNKWNGTCGCYFCSTANKYNRTIEKRWIKKEIESYMKEGD